ncbi:hypothetical protein MBLNU459_g0992t1 [Dothideomycetes sp. NU459]
MRWSRVLQALAAFRLSFPIVSAECDTYGIDYVDGGSYFLNIDSDAVFTLVQEFSGCQNDTADNIIVDPNGDQSECSDTPLIPDYTPQTVTCSNWTQNEMYSGEWSLVIISNNGDADPIAYQRDFSLSVGVQQTSTVTPTVTATATVTPVSTVYSTTTSTLTTTLVATTTTVKALIAAALPTLTSLPLPTISLVTKAAKVVTETVHLAQATSTIVYTTPSCIAPKPNFKPDPIATIVVTIIKSTTKRLVGAKFKRAIEEREAMDSEIKSQFVSERHEHLAAAAAPPPKKRSPDPPVVTVTETTTYITTTSTTYLPTQTVTLTSTVIVTSTSTPPAVTVTSALVSLSALQTIIQKAGIITVTKWIVQTNTVTTTQPYTVTITSTTTPASLAAACAATGGSLS